MFTGAHDVFCKQFNRGFFLVAIQHQTVHTGIVVVGFHEIQRHAEVGRLDGAEGFIGKHFALSRQLAENSLADVGTHLRQTGGGILSRQRLVLVVVVVANINLTQTVGAVVAVHFRQYAHFQTPVARDTQVVQYVHAHREFTGQRVAEAVEEIQIVLVAKNLFQSPDHWCNQ